MRDKVRKVLPLVPLGAFAAFLAAAHLMDVPLGKQMGRTFGSTLLQMMKLLPCAFILIALFDVWVKRETVQRHLGQSSGLRGYLWGILLGGMTVGGMYLAFPVAYSLFQKGAKLSVVLAYVGFAGVCRIPMTTFEATFMGGAFTAVRLGVSIPLVVIASHAMGRVLERRGYRITE